MWLWGTLNYQTLNVEYSMNFHNAFFFEDDIKTESGKTCGNGNAWSIISSQDWDSWNWDDYTTDSTDAYTHWRFKMTAVDGGGPEDGYRLYSMQFFGSESAPGKVLKTKILNSKQK